MYIYYSMYILSICSSLHIAKLNSYIFDVHPWYLQDYIEKQVHDPTILDCIISSIMKTLFWKKERDSTDRDILLYSTKERKRKQQKKRKWIVIAYIY